MSRNHVANSQPVEILLVTSALEKYKDVPFKENKALPNLNHRKAVLGKIESLPVNIGMVVNGLEYR